MKNIMKKTTNACWISFLSILLSYTKATNVENLKIGCYSDSPSSRQFSVSPGDYQPEHLTPYNCVYLCGNMKYDFAALQNGNLCFCARTFDANASQTENSSCYITCTGDHRYTCGGIWANLVYNSTSYTKTFVINYANPPRVFEWVNLTAAFVNESTPGLKVAFKFNIGDDGDSPGESAKFNFLASYWGEMSIKARPLNFYPKSDFVNLKINIGAAVQRAGLSCPLVVRTGDTIRCIAKIHQGTEITATFLFQNGERQNLSLPNPLYVRAGPAIPQWIVPGLQSLRNAGVFALPSSTFMYQAQILALEIYGHTPGVIRVFVMRPACSPPTSRYCLANLSCTSHSCSNHTSYTCLPPEVLCGSKSCCYVPRNAGCCSQSTKFTTLMAPDLIMTADIGVLAIKTGYNLHVISKERTLDVQPGDMIAWSPVTGEQSPGKIAQRASEATTYHFSSLDAQTLQLGSNVSVNQSQLISNVTYMINIIGSQASTFELSHQYLLPGNYWVQVNFSDGLRNILSPNVQVIFVQDPLTKIEPAYPKGFSFLGARPNKEIEIIVNVSSRTNLVLSWIYVNSSTLLKQETLESLGNDYVVGRLNRTFSSVGLHVILVEAKNNVSMVNTTISVYITDSLPDFNVSLASNPLYLGALTKFNVSASGPNVKFKWSFGDGSSTPYVSNKSVTHRFSNKGTLNVTVIANNLAFSKETHLTVTVLSPLSITVPSQGVVNVVVNFSCSLLGLFASDQLLIWDYGDGSTFDEVNKKQVSHMYSKGGTYNVSVKLKHYSHVYQSAEIFVLEPVSNVTLDNFTGVELFDSKTFIARTVTGNNLTYQWYLVSNKSITIMICANNSIQIFFNLTGSYIMSVNVSNTISSEFTSISFNVQTRISGLGITAFPNPASSNTTITFNLTKGTGSDVKYRLDFGDGFVLREFPPYFLFNRTFTSGQWQIILTGENAVSHVIVFYNVTVQDLLKNISVGFNTVKEVYGRKIMSVGSVTSFYSDVSEGTDVYFRWNFGDGSGSHTFKGSQILAGGSNNTVGHSFNRAGEFNVTVTAFNAISQLEAWDMVHAQEQIEGLELIVSEYVSFGESITFRFEQSKGNNITYIINFGDGGSSQRIVVNYIKRTYNRVGVFNVTVEAVNQISTQTMVKKITVQRKIRGFEFAHSITGVKTGSPTVISWKITDGSDVSFVVDFGDRTQTQTVKAQDVLTLRHNYTTWGTYSVTIIAFNLIGPNSTITQEAVVDDPIVGLAAYADHHTIDMYDNVTIVAKILQGSRVTYKFDFGDSSAQVETQTNNVTHQYFKYGLFTVVVTAENSQSSINQQVIDTIKVRKPNKPLQLRGLDVSCQATILGNASEILITYQYGFLFQCKVNFGDLTEKTFTDETLPCPLIHTYNTFGSFQITVKCENDLGSHTVKTTAHVDEIITGAKFKTGDGIIQKDFGQPVVVEWLWSTGTNVNQTVTLTGFGVINSHKTGQLGFVELDRTICSVPGTYSVNIELSNSVSSPQNLNAKVIFLEEISNLTVRFNPVVRTGSPTPFYVAVDSGLDLKIQWSYGDKIVDHRQFKGHGSQTFIVSHVFSTQADFQLKVLASNQNSRESVERYIKVLAPLQGFSFHQSNTVIWPDKEINFQFNRDSQFPNLQNASYYIEFGDGEKSQDVEMDPAQTHFSYKRMYSKPGCYKARLVIWNFVSRVELSASVKIIETITNAELKVVNSEYSAHPGTVGGGSTGNIFPFEYPVSFTIITDTGTCLSYDWLYGDAVQLRNVSTNAITHAYPLPGSYDVTAKIYNSLGEQTLRYPIILQYSVMGLYLTSSGPGKPGENVTFVIFCSSLGTNSQFVLSTGDGNNVTLRDFQSNVSLNVEKLVIDPNINLPFDPSSYFVKTYSHVYSAEGVFEVQVWGWNNASQKLARTSVVITNKSVPVPRVQVLGGKKSLLNVSSIIYGKRFSLSSRVEILSNERYSVEFEWQLFKADVYHTSMSSSHVQLPPETGRELSLPNHVTTNQSTITVPALGLTPGEYIFQVTVKISGEGLTNADYTYVKITGGDIEARITGGDLRSHDWEKELLLNASDSHDPLFPGNELDYKWFCNIADGERDIVNSGLGCFGNGEGQIEYTGLTFTIPPRSLFEATTYVFTVNISSRTTYRWSIASQTVKVLIGNPPDIQIRCESNCGKYVIPHHRLILKTTCVNCDNLQAVSYNWSAEDVRMSVPFPIWTANRTLTIQSFQNAVILGGTFHSGSSYRIRVSVRRLNSGAEGFSEYNVETNQPPKGGTCGVTPKTGKELGTTFTFTCSGWQDEHEPLTYEMSYSQYRHSEDPVSAQNSVLFFHGPSLTKAEFLLPAGAKERGYLIEVMIIIRDAYGEASEIKLPIQVKRRDVTRSELREKTLAPGNEIEKALGLGEHLIAVQTINIVSNILNSQNDTSHDAIMENQRIRLMMIKYLSSIRPQTLDDVLLSSQTLQTVTIVTKETTVNAQVLATKQYATMAEKLREESERGEDGEIIETISNQMLRGLSNVFLASTSSSSSSNGSAENEGKETSQEVISEVLSLIDTVSDAVLDTMIPEQKSVEMKSKGVVIGLSKELPSNLAGLSFYVEAGLGQFVLPNDDNLINRTKTNSYITATLTSLSANPFQGDSNSTEIKTNPLSLVLKGPGANVIPVVGLTSPIDIFLPQAEVTQIPPNISQTPSTGGSMTVHKVTLPNNDSTLKVEIIPSDGVSALTIFLRHNKPSSLSEYDFMTTLPHQDSMSGNYSLFIAPDQLKGSGDYYFGVLPSAHESNGEFSTTTLNYTFEVLSPACYFWNETSLQWSTRGCRVHNQSTSSLTRCQCTHLTWFGADLFIPPNKLDIKASIQKLTEIHKHPALLATYCVIVGLYILGVLWARRKDRKDITKVGLVPVLDNHPSHRYRYEVTVYTARGKNAGTTANASLLIAGEDDQSAVHVLKGASRDCLQQGSVDSFLITTPHCLGGLTFIRIWHDNTGKSPSWFLSQVVIRDIETDDKFFFLCNKWLACDEGDGHVDRLFPVAGKEELRDFVHLFKTKTSRDFSDGHLWFSIAFRPVRSRFTCVQRVSCCLSLLMCSMLANVLWYRTPIEKQNSVLIDFGFFEFTWHEIVIGIQSSLIVFPINLLIVQLFRNRSVSPKAKQKYAERTSVSNECKSLGSENHKARKQTAVSLSDITPTDSPKRQSNASSLTQKHVTLKNLTSLRAPASARMDLWEDDFFCSLLESQIGVSLPENKGKETQVAQKKTERDDKEGDSPDFLSSDIYYYLHQDETRDHDKGAVSPGSVSGRGSFQSTACLLPTEKPTVKTKKRKKFRCLFPWWFVYVGWFVCLSTAAAAGFFTLLYGLQFDDKQQKEWLVSMFVSMFQDILISQPLKVIIMAIFFALLFKKPQDEEDDIINAELASDEDWLEQNLTHALEGKHKTATTHSQRPPNKVLLHAARVRLFKEKKMHLVIREIVFYFLFVWMVLLIAYAHRDPYAHFMTQNMENTFVGYQESPGAREDDKPEVITEKPSGDDTMKLGDVTNVVDFWEWMNQTLVPGLFNGVWYNGQQGESGYLNDKMSYVVGQVRMRQLRVKSGTCQIDQVFETHMGACNEPYSWDAEDQTSNYAPGWKPANQNSSYNSACSAWHYKTTTDLKTRPFLGYLALYRGGGYHIDLGSSVEDANFVLNDLKFHQWVDKYTRAVFVEFTVYNGHSNLYCVANFLLEFTAAGGVIPFIQLLSTRIDRYVGHFLIFVLICEVAFVLFVLLFTYREFKRFLKTELKEYLTAFWTWIELLLISLSWTSIVLYAIRFALDKYTKKTFRKNPQQFVDFHHLALVDQLFGYVYAFLVFVTSIKFLRLFRFNRRMSLLGCTIKASARELCHFGVIFGLVFVGFSHLCFLVFSRELYKFHTFVTTAETLISVMLGKFSYVNLERTNRVLGPIMFFFYSIGVVFILINMFLSIIIENFKKVKHDNDLQSNEHEIIDFITDQFFNWLGFKSRSMFKNRVSTEREFARGKYKRMKRVDEAQKLKQRVDRLVTLIKEVHFDFSEDEDFLRNDGEVTYLIPEIQVKS